MLVIHISLWPGGDHTRARLLATGYITNDGSGCERFGNYNVRLHKTAAEVAARPWRKGEVVGFPRQLLGAWDLLLRALRATVGPRNDRHCREEEQRRLAGEAPREEL